MTEMNAAKVKALELAVQAGGESEAIVKRAHAFHGFLAGTAPAGGAAGAAPSGAKPGATAGAATGATAGAKTAGATAGAKTAGAKTDAKGAPAGAATTKPANKPAGAPAGSAAPPPDTKAPNGTNTYGDVVNKLREVLNDADLGRPVAETILLSVGGVKAVRDLKPAAYDKVVAAANQKLNGEGEAAGGGEEAFDDGTGGAETDDLGLPVG